MVMAKIADKMRPQTYVNDMKCEQQSDNNITKEPNKVILL